MSLREKEIDICVVIDQYIEEFNSYRITHTNLANCWISYLGLKKRHYEEAILIDKSACKILIDHCKHVLQKLSEGQGDLARDDLLRLYIYGMTL
jgi:hypothetical protein